MFLLDKPIVYYFVIKATNNHVRDVELISTIPPPNGKNDMRPGAVLSMTIKSNSRNPLTFRAYDKSSGRPVVINGKFVVNLYPSESPSQSNVQSLLIGGWFI